MNLLREYIKELINESYFPIYAQDKIRIHHSRQGTRLEDGPQISGFSQKIGRKPEGLWYECQDGSSTSWKDFCDAGLSGGYHHSVSPSGVRSVRYDSSFNVVLADNGYHMLNIPDVHSFDKFSEMYGVPHPVFPDDPEENMIDWPRVAKDYAGIEICPYLDSRRDIMWYYGWDVASGCVWDPSGIKELVEVKC